METPLPSPSDHLLSLASQACEALPPSTPSVESIPLSDFEAQWRAFISHQPSVCDNLAYKGLARLGYSWAVLYFQRVAREAHPK